MDLNELIDRTHFDYEQNETKAKQLEERILKVPGMSKSYLPKRKYGENYKGDQLGITASSLIVKGDKALAAAEYCFSCIALCIAFSKVQINIAVISGQFESPFSISSLSKR